jgi:hypothetical protein
MQVKEHTHRRCTRWNGLQSVTLLALTMLALLVGPQASLAAPEKTKKASPFQTRFGGSLLMGFRYTSNDPSRLRLGDSDGFYVNRARINVEGSLYGFRGVISVDGAFDRQAEPLDVSPAVRRLFVELRDAFISYNHKSGFFAMVGQSKVPFGMHSERGATAEHFIRYPLIAIGEDIAFGDQVRGIMPGRDIGLTLGFRRKFSLVTLSLEAMVYNGNGANTFANDSDLPAVASRLSVGIGSFLKIGASFLWNQRRLGDEPNLFDESEIAFGADIALNIAGFFLEGEFAARSTDFPTTNQQSAFGFGFRADAGYRIKAIGLEIAVRFEMYDATDLFDDDQLMYITPALTWYYRIWKSHELAIRLNYTIKIEQTEARTLNNDQLNVMFQYRF